jgi:hypothetical protein
MSAALLQSQELQEIEERCAEYQRQILGDHPLEASKLSPGSHLAIVDVTRLIHTCRVLGAQPRCQEEGNSGSVKRLAGLCEISVLLCGMIKEELDRTERKEGR